MGLSKMSELEADVLKKIAYFSGLDDATLESIAQQVEVIALNQGELLGSEGEECAGLYFVVGGSIKMSRISPEGREQVLAILGPMQSFNLVPVFDGGGNPATTAAMEPSVVALVRSEIMLRLVQEHSTLAIDLLRVLGARLRGLVTLVSDLTHLEVTGRIAKILIAYNQSSGSNELQLGQQDLASMVGTTREVAARALRVLEEGGGIKRRRNSVEIVSMEHLQEAMEESIR